MEPKLLVIVDDVSDNIINWLNGIAMHLPHLSNAVSCVKEKLNLGETHPVSKGATTNIACHHIKSVVDYRIACDNIGKYENSICFLDLVLGNFDETETGMELKVLTDDLRKRMAQGGVAIGRRYQANYNRILVLASSNVQASSHLWADMLGVSREDMLYVENYTRLACSDLGNALATLKAGLDIWYHTRIQDNHIVDVLNFIRQSIRENWHDTSTPFFHDLFEKKRGRLYREICTFLNLTPDDSGNHNSFKALFEFPATYPDGLTVYNRKSGFPKAITTKVFKSLLYKLNIPLEISGDTENWYFPIKPALPVFLALKTFLNSCRDSKPSLIISQNSLKEKMKERVHVELQIVFDSDCTLIERYQEKLHVNGLSGTSLGFHNLLYGQYDPLSSDPWRVLFNGGTTPIMEYKKTSDRSIVISWTV